eukprot:4095598-Amphidinium_carterae.1
MFAYSSLLRFTSLSHWRRTWEVVLHGVTNNGALIRTSRVCICGEAFSGVCCETVQAAFMVT